MATMLRDYEARFVDGRGPGEEPAPSEALALRVRRAGKDPRADPAERARLTRQLHRLEFLRDAPPLVRMNVRAVRRGARPIPVT